jgi:hypothetical protein
MRNLFRICAVILVFSPFTTANGQKDGKELLESCQEVIKATEGTVEPDYVLAMQCVSYIHGIADGHDATTYLQTKNSTGRAGWDSKSEAARRSFAIFCAPRSIQAQQEVQIVVHYLEQNPKQLHEQSATLVLHALSGAFPCK